MVGGTGKRIYLGVEVRRSLSRIGCNVVVMAQLGFASGYSLSPRLHESDLVFKLHPGDLGGKMSIRVFTFCAAYKPRVFSATQ